jgi:tetratricopeptide (TPR) repeat protein
MMKCPVCRAIYRPAPSPNCRRCGVDLSPLIRLHDQAVWHHRQAIQELQAGRYAEATVSNQQALALNASSDDFQALAGQLWALQGEFRPAIAAWKRARHLNPQHPTATRCLQGLTDFCATGGLGLGIGG